MAKTIILDTGFWYALYDERDQFHDKALLYSDYLHPHKLIIPWPSLYETLNSRFVKHSAWVTSFESYIRKPSVEIIPDEPYKNDALNKIFSADKKQRKYSLVDLIIREIISDNSIKVDSILTFNISDFFDICNKRKIENFNG